jgi:ADP-ribosyl-[dinitrogen reductase] hydrolase
LFAEIVSKALSGAPRQDLLSDLESVANSPSVTAIAQGRFANKARSEIRGSGYCVESMEAALWCFYNTSSFRDAVLEAVNLGEDADTTAAITGQIAGAFYGLSQIPPEWIDRLAMRELIDDLARRLFARAMGRRSPSN